MNVTPEVFVGRSGDLLYFESNVVAPGHSGGGLFNENWELLGMIRADQPPRGVAVSLDRLLERLGAWGYPLQFKIAAGISGRWADVDGQIAFTFKVLGNELFGTVEVARKDQAKKKKVSWTGGRSAMIESHFLRWRHYLGQRMIGNIQSGALPHACQE
jgi:hypothetical protein